MAGERARSKKKDVLVGYRTTRKKKRLIEKKLRKESRKLEYDITKSELLSGLVNKWLRNKGVPEDVIRNAEMSEYYREKQELLDEFNEWWYVHGHFEKNINKMKEIWDDITPEGRRQGKELMKKYEELREKYDEMFLIEEPRKGWR